MISMPELDLQCWNILYTYAITKIKASEVKVQLNVVFKNSGVLYNELLWVSRMAMFTVHSPPAPTPESPTASALLPQSTERMTLEVDMEFDPNSAYYSKDFTEGVHCLQEATACSWYGSRSPSCEGSHLIDSTFKLKIVIASLRRSWNSLCKDVLGSDVRAIRAVESGQPALPNTERDGGGKEARSTRSQDASGHSNTGLCSELRHLDETEGI
ncbi:hypothetical protein BT96DRAFT_938974 [Gymnopus androsaceus JB14]|uniref:Uncharacterized protein n=1 Tax=Gymnopus androsaceus JB14 TaxID=1447944 RepID=A0A6A4HRZ3_9AGAR|nr:hypothetical protein BT96DRAFT_938974 [Gymnopus androsaceus JB14]